MLLALVLSLVAVGQRLPARGLRIGSNAVAVGLLVYGLYTLATLSRL